MHGTVLQEVRGGAADFGLTYVDDLPRLTTWPRSRSGANALFSSHRRDTGWRSARARWHSEKWRASGWSPFSSGIRTRIRIIDAAAAKGGLTLRHAVTVSQFATMLRLVRAGAGLATPGSAVAGPGGEGLAPLPLARPGLMRRIGLVTPKGRAPGPVAAGLLAALRDGWPGSAINA